VDDEPDFLVLEDGGRFPPSYSDPGGFRDYAARRLGAARRLVRRRVERLDTTSDVKGQEGGSRGPWRILGVMLDRRATSTGNIEVILEDEEGSLRALVGRDAEKDIVSVLPDEPAIFLLEERRRRIWVKHVEGLGAAFRPGAAGPRRKQYAAFLSDLHCDDKSCDNLERFVRQIVDGALERDVLRNLLYLVIGGDTAGCGCDDPRGVYNEVSRILMKLPGEVVKVMIPGECDATPSVLPQPPIERQFRGMLEEVPNIHLLGNPSTVMMSGVRVLLYHGQTIPYVMRSLGLARPALAMRKLLSLRSLAPVLGSSGQIMFPGSVEGLDVGSAPDIFHAGHTHMADALKSENILFLSTPSWRGSRGPPVPTVAIVDLSSMDVLWRGPLLTQGWTL